MCRLRHASDDLLTTRSTAGRLTAGTNAIEVMALVPDFPALRTNDFFLFVASANDFQSSDVKMVDATGALVSYGDGRLNTGITNDAVFYAWRITIDTGRKFSRWTWRKRLESPGQGRLSVPLPQPLRKGFRGGFFFQGRSPTRCSNQGPGLIRVIFDPFRLTPPMSPLWSKIKA